MKHTPKISIITAVYNGSRYLEECIQSICSQTYTNVEHIVIDGGSTDGTQDILRRYEDRLHFWISEKDKGIYDAWNKGLAHANGDWIAFVGSDDVLWNDQVLENSIEYLHMALNKDIHFVYGKVNLVSNASRIISVWGESWETAKADFLQHMTVTHCCAFHHRSLFEEHGNFNDRFKITGDYEFLLREFVKGRDALFTGQVLAAMHAGGISSNLRSRLVLARENILARQLNGLQPTFRHRLQVRKAQFASFLSGIIGVKNLNRLTDTFRSLTGKEKIWTKIE